MFSLLRPKFPIIFNLILALNISNISYAQTLCGAGEHEVQMNGQTHYYFAEQADEDKKIIDSNIALSSGLNSYTKCLPNALVGNAKATACHLKVQNCTAGGGDVNLVSNSSITTALDCLNLARSQRDTCLVQNPSEDKPVFVTGIFEYDGRASIVSHTPTRQAGLKEGCYVEVDSCPDGSPEATQVTPGVFFDSFGSSDAEITNSGLTDYNFCAKRAFDYAQSCQSSSNGSTTARSYFYNDETLIFGFGLVYSSISETSKNNYEVKTPPDGRFIVDECSPTYDYFPLLLAGTQVGVPRGESDINELFQFAKATRSGSGTRDATNFIQKCDPLGNPPVPREKLVRLEGVNGIDAIVVNSFGRDIYLAPISVLETTIDVALLFGDLSYNGGETIPNSQLLQYRFANPTGVPGTNSISWTPVNAVDYIVVPETVEVSTLEINLTFVLFDGSIATSQVVIDASTAFDANDFVSVSRSRRVLSSRNISKKRRRKTSKRALRRSANGVLRVVKKRTRSK